MRLPQAMITEWWWPGPFQAFSNVCNQRHNRQLQYKTVDIAGEIQEHFINCLLFSWVALSGT